MGTALATKAPSTSVVTAQRLGASGVGQGSGFLVADKKLTVAAGVKRDLAEIAKRDKRLSESGLAATALALAADIDNPKNSATSRSMCARALNEALADLRRT
jgi:hypothetical protein